MQVTFSDSNRYGIDTRAIHSYRTERRVGDPVVSPLVQSTTYFQSGVENSVEHTYSRVSNPTVVELEQGLAGIEEVPFATCFSAGLAATHALLLAVARPGDHVVCGGGVYGGTVRLLREVLGPLGVRVTFGDASDPVIFGGLIAKGVTCVLVETPTNPGLAVCDLGLIAEKCRQVGARLVVDNTFLTGAGQRPLEFGANASLYSTTKWVEGHNLTVGGAVVTADEELDQRLRRLRKTIGSIQKPFEAWLTLRGLRSLPSRLRLHSANALRVASWLASRPDVARVNYPLLPSFDGFEVASRQQGVGSDRIGGGVLSFELLGGVGRARRFMAGLRLLIVAENLGAIESIVTHPATMTHGDVPDDLRRMAGVTDGLIRVSVGLENVEDILGDIEQAISRSGRDQ